MSLLHLVVRCITELGTCLEDPFGDDITDLPLDKFCQAVEMQVAAVFNDTFPSNTSYVGAWPARKVPIDDCSLVINDTSNSTAASSRITVARRHTIYTSETDSVTPDNSPVESYQEDISAAQLSTILSGDCLSGDASSGDEEV